MDDVLDNITLENQSFDPVPNVGMKIDKNCILGVAVFEKRMITILDFEKVHESLKKNIKQ